MGKLVAYLNLIVIAETHYQHPISFFFQKRTSLRKLVMSVNMGKPVWKIPSCSGKSPPPTLSIKPLCAHIMLIFCAPLQHPLYACPNQCRIFLASLCYWASPTQLHKSSSTMFLSHPCHPSGLVLHPHTFFPTHMVSFMDPVHLFLPMPHLCVPFMTYTPICPS